MACFTRKEVSSTHKQHICKELVCHCALFVSRAAARGQCSWQKIAFMTRAVNVQTVY